MRTRKPTTKTATQDNDDPTIWEGETLTLLWGQELHSPEQYNSVTVGGHSLTVTVQKDETLAGAYLRGWTALEAIVKMSADEKIQNHIKRCKAQKRRR